MEAADDAGVTKIWDAAKGTSAHQLSGSLACFSPNAERVLTVELEDAWPSKWNASDLSIQKSILWVETIIFQCEDISRINSAKTGTV